MSNIEYYTTDMRWGARVGQSDAVRPARSRARTLAAAWRFGEISGMIETAENLARDYGISREAADEFAARSHQRAAAAWEDGQVRRRGRARRRCRRRRASRSSFDRDEGIRARHHRRSLAQAATADARTAPSPRATPASRTTPPPPAWWWPRTSWTRSGWSRSAISWAGPRRAASRRAWASARCRRSRSCSRAPASASTTSTWSSSTRRSPCRCWRCCQGWGVKLTPTRRPAQRQRLGHLARPPDRRHRRPHPGHAAARAAAPRRRTRPGDDVHRRRPGHRRDLPGSRR